MERAGGLLKYLIKYLKNQVGCDRLNTEVRWKWDTINISKTAYHAARARKPTRGRIMENANYVLQALGRDAPIVAVQLTRGNSARVITAALVLWMQKARCSTGIRDRRGITKKASLLAGLLFLSGFSGRSKLGPFSTEQDNVLSTPLRCDAFPLA